MRGRYSGFTLLETLIVVAILGILAALALPGFSELIRSNQLTTASNGMLAAINNARTEAIKRGRRVVICKSSNGSSCNNGLTWSSGWIVFVDSNNDAARDASAGTTEELLRVGDGMSTLTATADTNVANYISFSNRGAAQLIAGGAQSGNVNFCIKGQNQRQISVLATGRASVVKGNVCP